MDTTKVHLPKQAEQYTLSAPTLRSTEMMLNGVPLTEPDALKYPGCLAIHRDAGTVAWRLEPAHSSCYQAGRRCHTENFKVWAQFFQLKLN